MNNVDKLTDAIALLNEKDAEIAALRCEITFLKDQLYVARTDTLKAYHETAALKKRIALFNPCGHTGFESSICEECGYPDSRKLISSLKERVKELEKALSYCINVDKESQQNITELEAENKLLQSELTKWLRPHDDSDLQFMKEQAADKSVAAKQAYINALEWHYKHAQADNKRLVEALEKIVIWAKGSTCEICGEKEMTDTDAYDIAREALKALAGKEDK